MSAEPKVLREWKYTNAQGITLRFRLSLVGDRPEVRFQGIPEHEHGWAFAGMEGVAAELVRLRAVEAERDEARKERDEVRALVCELIDEEGPTYDAEARAQAIKDAIEEKEAARARSLGAVPAPETEPEPEPEPAASPEVVDLMEALKLSLGEFKS